MSPESKEKYNNIHISTPILSNLISSHKKKYYHTKGNSINSQHGIK
jgi:hypothetical protein